MTTRETIVRRFAEWAAYSAARSGWPRAVPKDRGTVYELIRVPDYDRVISRGPTEPDKFDEWHRHSTLAICRREKALPVGWAAKLINVYLKIRVYVACEGPAGLKRCIHPPVDGILLARIRDECLQSSSTVPQCRFIRRIKQIVDYDEHYLPVIELCRQIAERRGWVLIEVDALWRPDP